MAFKRFGVKNYPLYGHDTAMQVLRPGAAYMSGKTFGVDGTSYVMWDDPNGKEPPTDKELEEELEREEWICAFYEYQIKKSEKYPYLIRKVYRFIVSLTAHS